jgi:hypothetical protein
MSRALQKYLEHVMIYANRNEKDTAQIRAELEDHLLKKIDDLQDQGLSCEDAIYQAIEDHGDPRIVGYGLRKRFPLLDVRTHGTARGFIAIGPKAIGIIAIGGVAAGVFSYGGISFGFMSLGLLSLGLIYSIGAFSLAPLGIAFGAIALGIMAMGLLSFGVTAMGVLAISLVRDPFYISDCVRIISWFTPETAPHFLLQIKNLIEDVLGWPFLVFWISCIVLLTAKLILSRKECRRIRQADPSLVE